VVYFAMYATRRAE